LADLRDAAVEPRPGEALDVDVVGSYLRGAIPGLEGDVRITQFPGGASNLTYLVRIGAAELVLRRPPFGTKARTAHDMGREFRVLSSLHAVFPYCPRPLAYCDDASLLGEPFYVMERLEGLILRRDVPAGLNLDEAAARSLCENLLDVHLQLHAIDPAAAGLADLGRPAGYVERQVSGWSSRYRNARTDDVPDNERLMRWLAEHMPPEAGRAAIIHNDYKFDNVVWATTDDGLRIRGVLDWEMATQGDPLMDLGCSLAYWIEADDPPPMLALRMMPTHLPGMLRRREIVRYYLDRAGLDVDDFRFYYVFGLFRLAVIVQQIYYRYTLGQTRDERFASFGRMATVLSGVASAVAAGERNL
jgi:aminoglycoside phosphotransferase (APT) family kinase protein